LDWESGNCINHIDLAGHVIVSNIIEENVLSAVISLVNHENLAA
jgi:hypothetical protein